MKKLILIILIFWMLIISAGAASMTLKWTAREFATGYKVYTSFDVGATWDAGVDVGDVLEYSMCEIPDSGLVLFRIVPYSAAGESIKRHMGNFYNGDWK